MATIIIEEPSEGEEEFEKKKKELKNKEKRKANNLNDNISSEQKEKLFNYIYGEKYVEMESRLNTMKESSKKYFNDIASIYHEKCQHLIDEFKSHFLKLAIKINNAFDLGSMATGECAADENKKELIRGVSMAYLDSFNSILEMNDQIFNSIKQNINILNNFIDITSTSLSHKSPAHSFLDKELINIINNWMFLKINFQDYNLANALSGADLDEKFINLCFNASEDKSFSVFLDKNNWQEDETSLNYFRKSSKQLSILSLNEVYDIRNIFDSDEEYPSLKSLYLNNIFTKDNTFFKKFTSLEKLMVNFYPNFDPKIFENLQLNNITELYLDKSGFINSDFNTILSEYLVKSDALRKNLQILSFEDNDISKIDFNQMIFSTKHSFYSLRELNLQKNRIYKFSINPEFFPSLKILNLCYNNFNGPCFNEYKTILVLLSGNIFLMDNDLCANYYTELEKKLNTPLPPTKSLCLSYAPKSFSQNYISNIKIGLSFLVNLLHLDLSYNHMNCDTFFSFLKNNKAYLNIKSLNLNGNELDDTFFEQFLEDRYNEIFENLEHLYLNNNLIGGDSEISYTDQTPIAEHCKGCEKIIYKLRFIYKFLLENKNLKEISIIRNPLRQFYRVKEQNTEETNKLIIKDTQGNIIINGLHSLLLKI